MSNVIEGTVGWAIVELMGRRRLAGRVTEVVKFGATMLRLDVPHDPPRKAAEGAEEFAATQYYWGGALYCVTMTTEAMARAVVARRPEEHQPVSRWELPAVASKPAPQDLEPDSTPEPYDAGDADDDLPV